LSIGIFFGAITAFISTLPAFINTILSVLANIGNEHEIFSIWNSRGSHIPSEFGNYPIITFVGIFLIIFWIVTILIGAFCGYLAGSSKNRELIVLPNSKNHI
jgi:hypothetical protein